MLSLLFWHLSNMICNHFCQLQQLNKCRGDNIKTKALYGLQWAYGTLRWTSCPITPVDFRECKEMHRYEGKVQQLMVIACPPKEPTFPEERWGGVGYTGDVDIKLYFLSWFY